MIIWQITLKDLHVIVRDLGALFTLLALPIVFIAILGVSTGQLITTHDNAKLIKIGVVDESVSPLADEIFNSLSGIGGLIAEKVSDRDEAHLQLQDGRINASMIFGKDFADKVDELVLRDIFNTEQGRFSHGLSSIDITVESGAEFAEVSKLVEYVALSAVLRVVGPKVARRSPLMRRSIDRMMEPDGENADVSNPGITSETVQPRSNIIYQTLVPAFMVMFAFFLINIMASSFINERNIGTLRRLQSTPISSLELLGGKTLPFLLVSVLQCALLFVSGKVIFGMWWGTYPWMLLPVLLATSLSATGLGLLLATVVRTESQVASYATFLVIVLAGISGCYMPRAWLPELMQEVSLATPHAWALIAYQELLTRNHPRIPLVMECCAMLVMFSVLFFSVGGLRFNRLDYRR